MWIYLFLGIVIQLFDYGKKIWQTSLKLHLSCWHHLLQKPTTVAQNAQFPSLLPPYKKSLPGFHSNIRMWNMKTNQMKNVVQWKKPINASAKRSYLSLHPSCDTFGIYRRWMCCIALPSPLTFWSFWKVASLHCGQLSCFWIFQKVALVLQHNMVNALRKWQCGIGGSHKNKNKHGERIEIKKESAQKQQSTCTAWNQNQSSFILQQAAKEKHKQQSTSEAWHSLQQCELFMMESPSDKKQKWLSSQLLFFTLPVGEGSTCNMPCLYFSNICYIFSGSRCYPKNI